MSRRALTSGVLAVLALVTAGSGTARPEAAAPKPPCVRTSDGARMIRFRAADGTRLLAVTVGRGRRGVVLAHHWRGSLCSWMAYARTLKARGFRVLVFDFRGHGFSGYPPYPRSGFYERDVAAAVRLIRNLGATDVALAGESMGGTIVLHAAAAMTPQPTAVVSLSAPTVFSRSNGVQAIARLRAPVLLVAAENDDGFPDEARALYAGAAPERTRLEIVPGGAHGADMLRAAAVRQLVTGFLEQPPRWASAAAGPAQTPAGTWSGTFTLPRSGAAVPIAVVLRGGTAVVTMGAGHPAESLVRARRSPGRLRFSLPGRPAPVAFDGVLRGPTIRGTVRQGATRGVFVLRRGTPGELAVPGLYAFDGGRHLVVADGFFGRNALELDAGELHLLTRTGAGRYAIGAGVGDRTPVGAATFAGATATWAVQGLPEERASRVPWRQEEVRIRSGEGTLGCTLTIPAGGGSRPAVAFAHGSGPAFRHHVATWASFFASAGMVTLACDKRGIGQSGGAYPGEAATAENIDRYARDVEAQARFLAAQPEVDDARIGVSGASQAGWIMPLAASREPAIRWLVLLVSPTVTQGESDLWGSLTGQGNLPVPRSFDAMEADVRRAGPSGFDPMPAIRSLRVPALWIYGAIDLHVPTRLSVERLDPVAREAGRDFTYVVMARGAHALIETDTGLNADVPRSSRYVAGLFTTVRDWLRTRRIAPVVS